MLLEGIERFLLRELLVTLLGIFFWLVLGSLRLIELVPYLVFLFFFSIIINVRNRE